MRVENGVKFLLTSRDGEGGFPGELNVEVSYLMSEEKNEFVIEYKANTTKMTPVDLTNHAYFNLAGHDSREKIYDHQFKIYADYYLDFDPNTLIATGKINTVSNTKYDFRELTSLGSRIDQSRLKWPEEGFDNYFILNQQSGKKLVASYENFFRIFFDFREDVHFLFVHS